MSLPDSPRPVLIHVQAELTDKCRKMIDALEVIATRRFPCEQCEKYHEYRTYDDNGTTRGTWSDPEDNHAFEQMSSSQFARKILKEVKDG
jgi:hypothetical protein